MDFIPCRFSGFMASRFLLPFVSVMIILAPEK
jgi:hypothetical protein